MRKYLKNNHFQFLNYYPIIYFFVLYLATNAAFAENSSKDENNFSSTPNYGDYLAGSYAAQMGDAFNAARYYKNILDLSPNNYQLKIKTIKLLLISGNIEQAENLYSTLEDFSKSEEIIKILGLTIDAKNKNYQSALKKIEMLCSQKKV